MLLATNIHLIDVSIDAYTEETYAKIRIGGNLNVTRGNVCALLKEVRDAGLKTKIIVSFVEQPENVHEAQAFERFWEDHGVDYVVIRRLHSNAGAISEVADIMRRDNADEIRRPCLYPWERIVLNARGYLAFCPVDWTHRGAFANYRQVTIRDVWQGDFYRKLREAHLTNHYDDHQFCGQCPDWKSTRWPREGRCYADMVEEFREKK
jgi:MoaA/NifB/PqqE/SkfB family radical SAM enzyme